MRPALIAPALILTAAVSACGAKESETAGPERRTAAGEVLGGEVSDAMVPLATVKSTSPAEPRPVASGSGAPRTSEDRSAVPPPPDVGDRPEPLPSDVGTEDVPSPPQS